MSCITCVTFMPNTMRRHAGAVALYRCTMARGAPFTASTVRAIRSSRDCVMTMMVTSSGIRFSSMRRRTKSKSVCDAAGKPTSISLKPMRTSSWKSFILRSPFIGSNSAWLPSRRSVESHTGARVMLRVGHWRSGKATGAMGWYLVAGLAIMRGSTNGVCGAPTRNGAVHGSIEIETNDIPCSPLHVQRLVRGPGSGGDQVLR